MMNASVTVLRPRDRTAAERSKRYRRKRKVVPAAIAPGGVTIDTAEMIALSVRLEAGTVTHDDLQMASRLVTALAMTLPPDSAIALTAAASARRG
jgi:hypothetical protein